MNGKAWQSDQESQPNLSGEKTGQVAGAVYRGDTHEPLSKATVLLYPQDDVTQRAAGGKRVVRTGDDGSFAFSNIPSGTYALEAARNGFVTASRPDSHSHFLLLHSGETIGDLKFSLLPAAILSGRVYDEDHEPVAGVTVLALRLTFQLGGKRLFSAVASATTNDLGAFRFSGLAPGDYYVRAGGMVQRGIKEMPIKQSPERTLQYGQTWFPDLATGGESLGLHVAAGSEMTDIEMRVATQSTYTIRGKIQRGPQNTLSPSEIDYTKDTPFEDMFGPAGAPIESDGSFVIQGLEPGEYTLMASSAPNGVMLRAGYAKVHVADRNVTVDIPLGEAAEVRGRLLLEQGVASVLRNLQMGLESVNRDELYISSVDSQGGFDIQNVPPGSYTFSLLRKPGEKLGLYPKHIQCGSADYTTSTVTLGVGTNLAGCDVTLADDVGAVTGEIRNGDQSLPNVVAVIVPQSRSLRLIPRYTLTARTDAAGRYEIQGVIPGDYYLFAVHPDEAHEWFATGFADSHLAEARSLTVSPGQAQRVDLKLTALQ